MLIGLSSIPAAPIGNALAVEITYPVPESMSNGMMNIPNILYGFAMGILSGYLCDVKSPPWVLALFSINSLIGFVATLFVKEDLRRLRPKASA